MDKPERLPYVFWAFLLALNVIIAIGTWHSVQVLTPDGTDYIHSGVSLMSGKGFVGIEGKPQLHYSPGLPIAIGLVHKIVADSVLAGRIVAVSSSIASVLLSALLATRLFGRRTGVAVALILSAMPIRIITSHQVLSEPLFMALVLAALWLWLEEADSHKPWRAALIGLALGYAYLARAEGLLCALVLAVIALFGKRFWNVPSRRSVAISALALVLVASPYVIYLRVHTGRWALSNKQAVRSACIAHSRGLWSPDICRLTSDNKNIDWTRFTETPQQLAVRYLANARREAHEAVTQIGVILKICFLLGMIFELHRGNKVLCRALPALLVLSLPLLYLPAFYPLPRYVFLGILPPLMLSCWQLTKRFSPSWAESAGSPVARAVVWTPVLIALAYTLVGTRAMFFTRANPSPSPEVVAWVRRIIPPREALITSDPTIVFYTGNRFVRLPYDDFDRVLAYAEHQRAKFLLVLQDDLRVYYGKSGGVSRAESEGKVRRVATLTLAGKPTASLLRVAARE